MKINPTNISPAATQAKPAITPPGVTTSRDTSNVEGPCVDAKGYSPSPELQRLLDLVKQDPEIREDRVREVAERLRKGEYDSAESLSKTANAFLSSAD